ncbi:MAG: LysM peptidoglycan-binding domain-containing protein [Lysinibacillus sp.]
MKKTFLTLATAFTVSAGAYATSTEAATHTVQSGESLWSISQQYNTSVDELKALNNLGSDLILPKQQLEVSAGGNSTSENGVHIVQPGDTLYKIGREHGVTVDQLMAWNHISNAHLIYAGDTIAVTAGTAAKPNPSQSTQQGTQQVAGESIQTMTMTATAYTAYCDGCSGTTANGTDLRANPDKKVIAVDPSVIPLGTRVWVEGYGEAIAADTGSAIKGNKIDVFIPSKEGALAWGRKTVKVTILK